MSESKGETKMSEFVKIFNPFDIKPKCLNCGHPYIETRKDYQEAVDDHLRAKISYEKFYLVQEIILDLVHMQQECQMLAQKQILIEVIKILTEIKYKLLRLGTKNADKSSEALKKVKAQVYQANIRRGSREQ